MENHLRKLILAFGVLAAVALLIGAGAIGYLWLQGGSGEASKPISAPTIAVPSATTQIQATPTERSQTATADPTRATATAAAAKTAEATSAAATQSPAVETKPAATQSAAAEKQSTTAAPATPAATQTQPAPTAVATKASASGVRYRIDPERSEVRFEIDEILRGAPNRVVGTTNQVAGELLIDLATPAASQLGVVRMNVRTLRTDDERRDRAIRSFVLESARNEYEFATFTPKALTGLPASVAPGAPVSFKIVGDLTLRDISAEVVFDATVTVTPAESVVGEAVAKIQRGTFKLTIPSVPSVASVGEEVVLGIKFFASAVKES